MTEEDAFLQAILENPEDDNIRLIFADWLEERGHPRAEFIRLQCESARMAPDDPRLRQIKTRESELLAAHEREWVGPLRHWVRSWQFRRGFVEEIALEVGAFLHRAEDFCSLYPIRRIDLVSAPESIGGDAGVQQLSRHPSLDRVHSLNLDFAYISADAVTALMASPYLVQLAGLHLNHNVVSDDGVRALTASPRAAGLVTLEIARNLVGDAGLESLATSRFLSRLTTLNLGGNSIGDAGVQALAASPLLAQLTTLDLSRNIIGDKGVQALAASPYLSNMKALDLENNPLSEEGLQALAECGCLNPLRPLNGAWTLPRINNRMLTSR